MTYILGGLICCAQKFNKERPRQEAGVEGRVRPVAKQDRAIRTRRAILEAAAAVFDEKGYEAAKLTDILDRVKLTKGALYFHFAGKEALALAVLDAQVKETPVPAPQVYKVQEYVDMGMMFTHLLANDSLLRASARLSLEQIPGLNRSSPYTEWVERNTEMLTEAKERGELLLHVDPAETARITVGAYGGMNAMVSALAPKLDLEHEILALYRHLLPSITVPAVLAELNVRPGRGGRVLAEAVLAPEPAEGAPLA
ncbi:ScbR family autoregulator-binding transcription factor [Streptomyces sp. NBC_01142]|uniref:ScbR family autoregulator-binding transcription factor n=1 Tax=Streptomyces sp. NBC_01142 TaxID=2975865 RepID=UPI00224D1A23|nr:ScbR family autoregulator-binding transcription factor [Streptomyces sp. NBC_01142]MCX4824935.1 ScbR family autoregulator-binding transcription factor [Streptomyces sp. NBC_01142]